ncbi:MAG: hypothetical protein ABFE01_13675 [Phycisphaerales bacterium]
MNWSQIRTILWLRWRLTRNQWTRGGRLSTGISLAIMVILLAIGVGGGIGGLYLGAFRLVKAPAGVLMVIYDALAIVFLVFWGIGVLSTIQRSESIDITKLLHLPVSLKGVFVVNYLASHVTLSIVVFLPASLGMTMGMVLGGRGMMLLLVPLILGFLFMVTAWTYCLRGWLVILMQNPRRYRAVVAGVTMTFVLLCQLPNLLNFKSWSGSHSSLQARTRAQGGPAGSPRKSEIPPGILLAHELVPPLWIGNGAMSLAAGNLTPSVLASAALFGIGGLGLARAYRSTLRFYEGRTTEKKVRPTQKEAVATPARRRILEWRLPFVPEDAAATALASVQSLRRATEIKMALALNTFFILVFAGTAVLSHSRSLSFRMQLFYATGMALLPFVGMTHLMTNQFGFDRSGFRTLVLSPMPRSQILLGKNLALLPVGMILGLVYLALAALGLGLGGTVILAAVVQLIAAFFLVSILGNLISSLLPFRIREGTLGATKIGVTRVLLNMIAHLITMAILSLLFAPALATSLTFPTDGLPARLAYLFLSIAELAIIVTIYSLSLFGLGELLQSREKEILRVVTQEVE